MLAVGDGRLGIIQNVHGDLGDLPGRPVGTVAGHLATAYRVLGSDVVQWEDAGHWYAVMGTGLASGDVERFALSMRRSLGARVSTRERRCDAATLGSAAAVCYTTAPPRRRGPELSL